jgi:hypothetical protein
VHQPEAGLARTATGGNGLGGLSTQLQNRAGR